MPNIVYNNDELIESIKTFDNLWDYIKLFNQTGLVVTCERRYIDIEDRSYDYCIVYSMFGTYVTDNNTDKFPDGTDGGVYLMGPAISWSNADNADINVIDNREYTEEERYEHIARFYDSHGVIPTLG